MAVSDINLPAQSVPAVNVPGAVALPAAPGGANELIQLVFSKYPSYAYLLAIPEVRDLLIEAVTPGSEFSPEVFAAKLYATNWWRTTQAAVRDWDARWAQDPASGQAQVRGRVAEIRDIAGQAGLSLTDNQLLQFAQQTLRFGISTGSSEFRDALALLVPGFDQAEGKTPSGQFGVIHAQIKQLARSYLMPLSDRDAWELAQKVFAGDLTVEGLQVTWAQQAAGRSPQFAQAIEAGMTPLDYFRPIVGAVSAELEMSADAIDLMDPQWSDLLGVDDGSGGTRLMTLSEAQRWARSRPEWNHTQRANDQSASLGKTLIEQFGGAIF